MRQLKRLLIVLVVLGTTIVPLGSVAHAADANDKIERITLSPAVAKPQFAAGDTKTGKLEVINDGQQDYTFVLYARPFSVQGENYDPNYTEVNEHTEAYRWVQFDKTEYTLKAGQRVEAPYTINVPKNAAGGGHYAVLFAETQPPAGSKDSVVRKKRVGSILYMTVDGTIIQKGSLASWDVTTWQKKGPVTSNVRIKNAGNTHFQANLTVNYNSVLGNKNFQLNQESIILPGTTRKLPVEWKNAPYMGIFKASGTVKYLDRTDVLATKYIVLLPIKAVVIFAAVVVLLLGYLVIKVRGRSKNESKKGKKSNQKD